MTGGGKVDLEGHTQQEGEGERDTDRDTGTEGQREVFWGWVSWLDRRRWDILTLLRFSFQGDHFDKGGSV